MAWIALGRPNAAKLCPPGPLKLTRSDGCSARIDDASQAHAVERNETVDVLGRETGFHAAQIAQFFFAHGSDKTMSPTCARPTC
jgi:hypothetical protein